MFVQKRMRGYIKKVWLPQHVCVRGSVLLNLQLYCFTYTTM